MSQHHKKSRVELQLENDRLQELISEQLAIMSRVDQTSETQPQLLITDSAQLLKSDMACLILGKDISLPLRLGELKDKVLYALSGREDLIEGDEAYDLGSFTLYAERNILRHKQTGDEIRLTDKERLFLRTLYDAENHVQTRKDLLETVWGYVEDTETHTLETHLYRLRQKLEPYDAGDLVFADGEGAYGLKI